MGAYAFLIILVLTFPVFFVPKSIKHSYSLVLIVSGIILSSWWCYKLFSGNNDILVIQPEILFTAGNFSFILDPLSAFFIIVINITTPIALIYARGYLKPYAGRKNSIRFSIHYFAYMWLYLSMIMVVMIRDALPFLVAWEIMAVTSFLLVIFDAEDTAVMKSGINYLIQMHVGMFFILIAFLISGRNSVNSGFDSLPEYFSSHSDIKLFLLFFIGFGIKAGFMPAHTWLPQAHPAAPSHVSGLMSGVMIKMGIYGILRVLVAVHDNLLLIGSVILAVSIISAILGIMMAIMQNDLKKMLAYSSIENVGIIGIGIGLGTIGSATGNNILGILGYGGSLMHVFNHSLFKSVLFFNAGSVYHSTHSRNTEQLGGLIRNMPYTSTLFLIGALAISGLPPFNGFISEYLLFSGMFKSLPSASLFQSIAILGSAVGLAFTGGLAVFCFTKAFGITFLGQARTTMASYAKEAEGSMIFPQFISVALIILTGLASPLFVSPVFEIVSDTFSIRDANMAGNTFLTNLSGISISAGIFVLLVVFLLTIRRIHLRSKIIRYGPTWGCGYTAPSAKQQYTSASYSYNYNHLAKPVLQTGKVMKDIEEAEIFPARRSFITSAEDAFKKYLVDKPVDLVSGLLKRIAVMQTGRIQDYILYAFIFMLVILILSWLNLI